MKNTNRLPNYKNRVTSIKEDRGVNWEDKLKRTGKKCKMLLKKIDHWLQNENK